MRRQQNWKHHQYGQQEAASDTCGHTTKSFDPIETYNIKIPGLSKSENVPFIQPTS